jgi:hypothetical protein
MLNKIGSANVLNINFNAALLSDIPICFPAHTIEITMAYFVPYFRLIRI